MGNVDKHRYSHPSGIKGVQETSKWDTAKAVEPIRNPDMKPRDMSGPQRLGDANNLQGPGYSNDVANDWRRGGGASGAEGKPNFDRGLRRPGKV
jgi:hypothetical protein